MHDFRKLEVWQKAMKTVQLCYELTSGFTPDERFGLTSQINRCSVSIPANIAEGSGRNTNKDFARFLSIANGSAYELETLLILSGKVLDTNQILIQNILDDLKQIQKMIYKLIEKLRN